MPIVSSTFILDHAQVDGRRYVTEIHTDHLGVERRCQYLANADADCQAIANARGAAISESLAQQEIDEVLNGD